MAPEAWAFITTTVLSLLMAGLALRSAMRSERGATIKDLERGLREQIAQLKAELHELKIRYLDTEQECRRLAQKELDLTERLVASQQEALQLHTKYFELLRTKGE